MLNILKKIFNQKPATDFDELVRDGALVVDVRTTSEFKSGHINGAINIPLDQLNNKLNELKIRNKPVITCCRSGNRSGAARDILQAAGVECYNGGAWNLLNNKIKNK